MTQNYDGLVYLPLGGAGEIGMNMYLYGIGAGRKRRWIMVDCGIGFGDMESSPGIEVMMADPAFIVAEREGLEAIFITHAHEDHVGAIGRLWPRLRAPIYCTKFAASVARRKLDECGIDGRNVKTCQPHKPMDTGSFRVSFFPVTHSIPDAMALVIETDQGRIVHTGDFKIDKTPVVGRPMDLNALEKLGDDGVMALVCDSTNVVSGGRSGSEADLQKDLIRLMSDCEGAVAATTFASNVVRLRTLAEAAIEAGRSVVVAGRAMSRMIETALETESIPDFPGLITEDRANQLPARHLFYLVTGSQGEGRAALARIAGGTHPSVKLKSGDMVLFSSRTIPGNETGVYRLYNRLSEQGVQVIDESDGHIHVSGHARRDEMAELYAALKPTIAVPMHGEHRHLSIHAEWARKWGAKHSLVAPNGTMVALDPDAPRIIDDIDAGRLYLDGETLIGAFDGVVLERLKIARQGLVVVSLVLDDDGDLLADPEVETQGAPKDGEGWAGPLDEMISEAVDDAIEGAARATRRNETALKEMVSVAARRVCGRYWGKKPVIVVTITRLEE